VLQGVYQFGDPSFISCTVTMQKGRQYQAPITIPLPPLHHNFYLFFNFYIMLVAIDSNKLLITD